LGLDGPHRSSLGADVMNPLWSRLFVVLAISVVAETACNDLEDRVAPSKPRTAVVAGAGGVDSPPDEMSSGSGAGGDAAPHGEAGFSAGGEIAFPSGGAGHAGAEPASGGRPVSSEGGRDPGPTAGASAGMGGSGEPPSDPECDYFEWVDTTDWDSLAYVEEHTGDDVLTICGVFENVKAAPDHDEYKLPVGETGSYAISLVLSEPMEGLFLKAWFPGTYPENSGSVRTADTLARVLVQATELGEGEFGLSFDGDIYWDVQSVSYKLRVRKQEPTPPCEPVSSDQAAHSYAEAHDGPDHKGNDELRYPDLLLDGPFFWYVDYPSEAEDSGIVVRPGERSLLQGQSAAVPYAVNDWNQDRDTFLIRTGDVNQLKLHVESPTDLGALSVRVFPAGDLWSLEQPPKPAIVMPEEEYWIYVGGSGIEEGGAPKPYTITICGEKFEP
jgi:hypothetical protein